VSGKALGRFNVASDYFLESYLFAAVEIVVQAFLAGSWMKSVLNGRS